MAKERPKFRRILLKLSGEAFGPPGGQGLDIERVESLAREVKETAEAGVSMAVVVGAGNIVRGREFSARGVDADTADYMGMLGTVINAMALQDALERIGVDTGLQSAIGMQGLAEPYVRRRCLRLLEEGRVVILAGGTGSPHFTTDTAAAIRAREIRADVLLKATNVDGVYSDDPRRNPNARKYDTLTYMDVLNNRLGIMDATAITTCMDGNIPIVVFNLEQPGNIARVVKGDLTGTYIGRDPDADR